ncbi:hypothetical protein GCM10023232_06260 [Sphingosinicella ginsenosidimutans]|uniref:YtxH domain-containing protein n=1 Tax=Allosphingosinicella ginsenosidimutans TaxID=1176539 RepID=A0A5C6TVT3_9SPHN|nr:hypothetical protein [Sphingosinicella ginsenosidimutans]TXC64467.1 hypothetical protein FRZ32_12875 [Sphingosinicella ginsenosidimutans]
MTAPKNKASRPAIEQARERTLSAYESARSRAADVTRDVTDQMAVYPVAAVIGGMAVGALLGFLLPRTQREREWLGDAGRKLTGAARDVAQKGLDAGRERADQFTGHIVNTLGASIVEAVGGKDDAAD